jgi:uncharacterized oxidoreductase
MVEAVIVPCNALHGLTKRIFEHLGAPEDIAGLVSDALVDSSLAGYNSHGVLRIVEYAQAIASDALDPRARAEVIRKQGAVAVVDGKSGFGQIAGVTAIDEAVRRAGLYGIAAVSVIRCHHLGRMGYFMERAVAQGVAALSFTGGFGQPWHAAPYGGARPAYSTNPFAAGFLGSGDTPVIVDFATTAIAGGKVLEAHSMGSPLPTGVLIDKNGHEATDPAQLWDDGALLPFGSHKGYGLALMIELLCQALISPDDIRTDAGRSIFDGACTLFVAIDAGAFHAKERTHSAAAEILARVRKTPPAAGFDSVRIPGDRAAATRKERRSKGIPIPSNAWAQLVGLARRLKVEDESLK